MTHKLGLLALLLFTCALGFAQTHSVVLAWNDTVNPAGTTYNVYRAVGACGATGTSFGTTPLVGGLTLKTVTDAAVTIGTTYCYQVTAVDGQVESGPSNQAGGTIPNSPPTGLTVTVR